MSNYNEYDDQQSKPTALLEMAQKVHDEYISNGRSEAERLKSEATAQAEAIIREADSYREKVLAQAREEESQIQQNIAALRKVEFEYRKSLKVAAEATLDSLAVQTENANYDNPANQETADA